MNRRRLLVTLAVVVFLVVAAVAYAFTTTWESPELGRRILAQAGSLGGLEIEAETFRLSLLDGLRLGKVHAETELPAGHVVLDADAIVLQHRLGPLLGKEIHVERIVLERPRLVVQEAAPTTVSPAAPSGDGEAGQAPPSAPAGAGAGFSAKILEIQLADATIETRPADPALLPTVIEGLDLILRDLDTRDTNRLLASLQGQGDVTVDRIDAAGTVVTDARGTLRIGDGRLAVEGMTFDVVGGGAMTVPRFDLQLGSEDLLFDMELRGALDVESLLGVSDTLIGGADLVFEGHGPLTDVFAVAGNGRVEVKEGKLPSAKVFQLVDGLLGDSVLVGAQYQLFNVVYKLQNQKVVLDAFDIGTPNAGLTISGEASLDGAIKVFLEVRLPREMIDIDEIPPEALDVLQDDNGQVRLPFQIGGPATDPKVVLARSAVMAAARQGMKREVQKRASDELGKALRGLFSKDKKGGGR